MVQNVIIVEIVAHKPCVVLEAGRESADAMA